MYNDDEFIMDDDKEFQNIKMDDVEKIGEGMDVAGALIMAAGAVITGVIGLIKLFSDNE